MGEHLLCKQGVVGSNPFISTTNLRKFIKRKAKRLETQIPKWAHSSAG